MTRGNTEYQNHQCSSIHISRLYADIMEYLHKQDKMETNVSVYGCLHRRSEEISLKTMTMISQAFLYTNVNWP